MDFQLIEEQQLVSQTASDIATEEFEETAFTWENEFPARNQQILADRGLLGIGLSIEYSGGGYSPVEVLVAQEAVGRICPDTARILSRSSMGPLRVIAELGSEYLKETYLPDVCTGETILSIAISEPEAGSDAGNMQTSIEYNSDELVLNGSKMWVTKAEQCSAFLVYARFPDDNIGAIVVDKDTPGFSLDDGTTNMAGHVQNKLYFDDWYVREGQAGAMENPDVLDQRLEDLEEDRFVIGSPETVTDRLVNLYENVGLDCVLMGMHRPGIPHSDLLRSIELVGEEVIPAVRERIDAE